MSNVANETFRTFFSPCLRVWITRLSLEFFCDLCLRSIISCNYEYFGESTIISIKDKFVDIHYIIVVCMRCAMLMQLTMEFHISHIIINIFMHLTWMELVLGERSNSKMGHDAIQKMKMKFFFSLILVILFFFVDGMKRREEIGPSDDEWKRKRMIKKTWSMNVFLLSQHS